MNAHHPNEFMSLTNKCSFIEPRVLNESEIHKKKEVPLSSVYLWLWWVIPFRLRNETPFVFMIHFHCRALSLCSHITVWSLSQNEKNFFSSIKLFRCISRDRFSSNLIFFENWNIFFFLINGITFSHTSYFQRLTATKMVRNVYKVVIDFLFKWKITPVTNFIDGWPSMSI